jgi:hypothetical protein
LDGIRRSARAGIYLWAAESVFFLEGTSQAFLKWCEAAAREDAAAPRLLRLARRSGVFAIDARTGAFSISSWEQPAEPPPDAKKVTVGLDRIGQHPYWIGAVVERGTVTRVRTPEGAWEYAAEIPLPEVTDFDPGYWYWVRLELDVVVGQIGVAVLVGSDIAHEQILSRAQGRQSVFVTVSAGHGSGIVIRNGGLRQSSTVELLGLSLHSCPRFQ